MDQRSMLILLVLLLVQISSLGTHVQSQDSPAGFISIDCGATNDYYDDELKTHFTIDETFIDSGENRQISYQNIIENLRLQAKNLRMFPNGTRNCYTLRPEQGKGNTYLIRGLFYYANYDNKNQTPVFDLHLGVNYWTTVSSTSFDYREVIYVPKTDDIQVCLINTGNGVPYINALELRLLDNTIYQLESALNLRWRQDLGGSYIHRYPEDVFDRIWWYSSYSYLDTINTTMITTLSDNNDAYKVPPNILSTAQKGVANSIEMDWPASSTDKWRIYLHFAELEALPSGQQREFRASINQIKSETITLKYLKPVTVALGPVSGSQLMINATERSSQYPPILNAYEFYTVVDVEQPHVPTASIDVKAMRDIKKEYGVNRESWQGDPCVPNEYIWDGLKCDSGSPPQRILSVNLSFSKLSGEIADSFSNLQALESLDLSNNQLTGPVPDFLAKLSNLKFLWVISIIISDLSGNNLNGSIPESLRKKATGQTLQFRLLGNPNLCLERSCNPKKKTSFAVIITAAVISLAVVILIVSLAIIWMMKTRKGKGHNEGTIKSRNRPFTYSEVLRITDNFKTVIGEGGFGKVYFGTLGNGTKVAVKMLSMTSKQGCKEFQAEAQLLMIVHHRNLVSLVGYCDDAKNMALIYEYMEKGNLQQLLSDPSIDDDTHILTWKQRLRIALDAAQGLDYLHNGCKPPIIHRDLKTPNILLNESMQAKIADFGLSKAFMTENDSHIFTRPAGTPGYLDPEFQTSGNLNRKSDVYSFGIILFELITGYPAVIRSPEGIVHIVQWMTPIIHRGDIHGIVDPRLNGEFNINTAWKLVEIAMSCVPATAIQRPDIANVLAELKECWALETAQEGSQRMKIIRGKPTESFGITLLDPECDSVPVAR